MNGPGPGVALRAWVHRADPGDGGPPIALVHGSMDRGAAFARVVPHLGPADVLRYDRRGYGGSVGAGPPAGLDGHADDLAALLVSELGGRPTAVIGHSLGGLVALHVAARHPALVAVVGTYEAPLSWLDWWSAHSAGSVAVATDDPGDAAEAFVRRMVGDERWAAQPPATRRHRRAEGPALVAELRSARDPDAAVDVGALAAAGIAVHVACGSEARPHHRRGSAELATAAGTPLVVLAGAGHGAHLSHPAEFGRWARAVRDA